MKKVVFLGMGGTIAGRASAASDNVGYTAAQVPLADLLTPIPGLLAALQGAALVAEQVAQLDSKDMTHAAWWSLAARVVEHLQDSEVQAVVITHGTDTLEETAYFLHRVIPPTLQRSKAVVMTCAMRPATAFFADGPQNVLDAATLAMTPAAHGVLVACAGQVHAAVDVRKEQPYRMLAFSSGEAGVLGVVEEGRYRAFKPWPLAQEAVVPWPLSTPAQWPRVEVVTSHAGVDGHLVLCLCNAKSTSGLRGLVVEATGNGSLHMELEAALVQAMEDGIRVALTTRCSGGTMVGTPRGASLGMTPMDLTPAKARIALMLELLASPLGG